MKKSSRTNLAPRQSGRTKRGHHLSVTLLRGGYKEQRAWLSVGMETHRVELALEPWAELPLVVRYQVTNVNKSIRFEAEKRYPQTQINAARLQFKTAGQPGDWPSIPTVQSL